MDSKQRLQNLKDAIVDDILNMRDEEVWQEFVEECGSVEAAQAKMRKINIAFGNIVAKAKEKSCE